LQDTLAIAVSQSNAHYTCIPTNVVDIDPTHRVVICADGQQFSADHIILALGHAPIANPLARWAPVPQRVMNGYDWQAITTQINSADDIIIIGSGLTMVDTIVALQNHGHQGNITAFSRHGHLPQPHIPRQSYPPFITSDHYGWSVVDLIRLVRTEVAKAHAAGIPWQAVIDSLLRRTRAALPLRPWRSLGLSGGVANNGALRRAMSAEADQAGLEFLAAAPRHTGDNAGMIGFAAWSDVDGTQRAAGYDLSVEPNAPLA
jgi:uncharacterized NAD(P)/FAD-binding protein YdhS